MCAVRTGKALADALQTTGGRDRGFRGALGSIGADTNDLIKGYVPAQIASVAPMSDIEAMLKILTALA